MATFLESSGVLLTVLTPLVAVPLTVITFYLRSLREHQLTWQAELVRRFEALEGSNADLRKAVGDFERDYTTKEEWLRECMHARRKIEQLAETTVRLEANLDGIVSALQGERGAGRRRTGGVGGDSARSDESPVEHEGGK